MSLVLFTLSAIFMVAGIGFAIKTEIRTKKYKDEYNDLLSGRKAQKEA